MNLNDIIPADHVMVLAWMYENFKNFKFEIRGNDIWEVSTLYPDAEWHRSESIEWWKGRIELRKARNR